MSLITDTKTLAILGENALVSTKITLNPSTSRDATLSDAKIWRPHPSIGNPPQTFPADLIVAVWWQPFAGLNFHQNYINLTIDPNYSDGTTTFSGTILFEYNFYDNSEPPSTTNNMSIEAFALVKIPL